MNLLQHAQRELEIAGYNLEDVNAVEDINTDDDYGNMIAKSVLQLIQTFASQNHSGYSASTTLSLFDKLVRFDNITELTDNPKDWINHKTQGWTEYDCWQSLRNSSCFSYDNLKTYTDNDDPANNVETEPGWVHLKPMEDRIFKPLKHVGV